jgi:DNA-binding XRE family transcriptional regulator
MKRTKRSKPKTALRRYRDELGLKQTDVAAAFGVSEGTYRQWEHGKVEAWLRLACKGYAFCLRAGLSDAEWTGDQLVEARNRMTMTQLDLAVAFDLSRATIGRYEAGTPPKWVTFAVLALAFDSAPAP